MATHDTSEVQRLRTQLADAERNTQRLTSQYEKKLAENERLNKAADALGKAITVLHKIGDPSGKAENN